MLAIAGLVLGLLAWGARASPVRQAPSPPPLAIPLPAPPELEVMVAGAVANPGLYRLPYGSRVADAIVAAGGYGAQADPNRLPDLAKRLRDGMSVRVVAWGQASGGGRGGGAATDKVNVNSADVGGLLTIPQMTLPMAENIVAYREAVGVVRSLSELQLEMGLDAETWRALRPWLTTGL